MSYECIKNRLWAIRTMILYLKSQGKDMTQEEKLFFSAQQPLINGEYEHCESIIETILQSRQKLPEIAWIDAFLTDSGLDESAGAVILPPPEFPSDCDPVGDTGARIQGITVSGTHDADGFEEAADPTTQPDGHFSDRFVSKDDILEEFWLTRAYLRHARANGYEFKADEEQYLTTKGALQRGDYTTGLRVCHEIMDHIDRELQLDDETRSVIVDQMVTEVAQMQDAWLSDEIEAMLSETLSQIIQIRHPYVDPKRAEDLLSLANQKFERNRFWESLQLSMHAVQFARYAQYQFFSIGPLRRIELGAITIAEVENKGTPAQEAKILIRLAKAALRDCRYIRAEILAKRAAKVAKDKRRIYLLTEAEKALTIANVIFERTKYHSIDVTEAENLLAEATQARQMGEFVKAEVLARKAQDLLIELYNSTIHKRVQEQIGDAELIIDDLKHLGIGHDRVRDLFGQAIGFFETEDYENAEYCSRRAIEIGQRLKSNYARERAQKEMTLTQERMMYAKGKGILSGEASELYALAEAAFDAGDFDDAHRYAKEAHEKVETAEFHHWIFEAEKAINSAESLIEMVSDEGLDLGDAEKTLARARQAHVKKEYQSAAELANKVEQLVRDAENEHIRAQLEATYATAEEEIKAHVSPELDISEALTQLAQARTSIDAADFSKAERLIGQARQTANLLELHFNIERAEQAIYDGQQAIEQAINLGLDATRAQESLAEASTAFDSADYHVAMGSAEHALELAQNLIRRHFQSASDDLFPAVEAQIDDCTAQGLATEEFLAPFRESQQLASAGDFERAYEILAKINDRAEQALISHQAETVRSHLAEIAKMITELERLGVETDTVHNDVSAIENTYSIGEYEAARSAAVELIETLKHDLVVTHQKRAKQLLRSTEERLEELKALDVDRKTVTGFMQRFLKAKQRSLAKDYSTAESLLDSLGADIERKKRPKLEKRTRKVIDRVRGRIDQIRTSSNAVDLTEAEFFLDEALTALEGADFDMAIEYAERAETEAHQAFTDYKRTRAQEALVKAETLLSELEETSELVTLPESAVAAIAENRTRLADARRLFEAEGYTDARSSALAAATELEAVNNESMSLRAEASLAAMHEAHTQAQEREIQSSYARQLMEQAEHAFANGDYADADQFAKRAEEIWTEAQVQDQAQSAMNIIMSITPILDNAKRVGADVSAAEELFNRMKQAFSDKAYKSVLELAQEVRLEAEKAKLKHRTEHANEQLIMIKRYLNRLKELGVGVEKIKEYSIKAIEFAKQNNYTKLAGVVEQVKTIVEREEQSYREMVEGRIEEARQLITKTRNFGVDTDPLTALLDEANHQLETDELLTANGTVAKLKERARAAQVEHLLTRSLASIAEREEKVEAAAADGIDTTQAHRLLGKVQAALSDQEFTKIELLLREVDTSLTTAVRRKSEHGAKLEITRTNSLISSYKVRGIPLETAERTILAARNAYIQQDYDRAVSLAKQAGDEARAAKTDYECEQAHTQLDEAQTKLKQIEDLGLDTAKVAALTDVAASAFEAEEYIKSAQQAHTAVRTADLIYTGYLATKAQKALTKAQRTVAELLTTGVERDPFEAKLGQIRSLFEAGEFQATEAQCEQLVVEVAEARVAYQTELTISRIIATETAIRRIRSIGVDVHEADELLARAKALMKSKDFKKARELARDAENRAQSLRRSHVLSRASKMLSQMQARIEAVKAKNINVDTAEALLRDGQQQLRNEQFGDLEQLPAKIDALLAEAEKDHFSTIAREALLAAKERLEHFYRTVDGIDLSDAVTSLKLAKFEYDSERHQEAAKIAQRVKKEVEAQVRSYIESDVKQHLERTEALLSELQKLPVTLTSIEEQYHKAYASYHASEFDDAKQLAIKAYSRLEKIQKRYLSERAAEAITNVRKLLEWLTDYGVDVTRPRIVFDQAKVAFDNGEYEKTHALARKAETIADELRKKYLSQQAIEVIHNVQPILERIRQQGPDITQADELFKRSRAMFSEKEYLKAKEYAQQAKNLANKALVLYNARRTKEALETVKVAIDELQIMGERMEDIKPFFTRAMEYAKAQDIDALMATVGEVQSLLDTKKRMVQVETMITSTLSLGIEVGTAESVLDRARSALEDGDNDAALTLLDEAEGEALEAKRQYLMKNAFSIISKLDLRIRRSTADSADVAKATDLLKEAKMALTTSDFDALERLTREIDILLTSDQ